MEAKQNVRLMGSNVMGGPGDGKPALQYRCKDMKYFVTNKLLRNYFYEC